MSKVRVAAFSISLDGFGAGPSQDLQNPLGVAGLELHGWFFTTDAFKKMHGQGDGTRGVDNDVAEQSFANVGAWILGRNMFGPVRGPWNDRPGDSWKGWWGDNPPYHTPVFVLTHHPRPALGMEGGTTFHFVTDGAESALNRPGKRPRAGYESAVEFLPFVNISLQGRLTKCIWPCRRSYWAKGNTYFPESISPSLVSLRTRRLLERMRPTFL